MIGLAIFMFYYPYQVLSEVIPFAFTQPDLWENHWLVKYDGEIPFVLRACYLTLWLIPILATVAMTATAIHFFYLLQQEIYFDLRVVRDIQILGVCASIAGIGVSLGYSLTDWLVTFMNIDDRRGIQFGYDPTEVSLILTGIGLCLGGWLLKTVVLQDLENREFV